MMFTNKLVNVMFKSKNILLFTKLQNNIISNNMIRYNFSTQSSVFDSKEIKDNKEILKQEYKPEIDSILKKYDENKERKQSIVGVVVSTKASKTITVKYFHKKFISKYNTFLSIRRKVLAHDEDEICNDGDIVRVVPCRPMSKRKRHKIIDIIVKEKKLDYDITHAAVETDYAKKSKEIKRKKLAMKLQKKNKKK